MALRETLRRSLSSPRARDLWDLRAELLEAGCPPGAPVWRVLEEFGGYLDRLATGSSSRQYSELASKLDISAVGGVVLEHLFERETAEDLAARVLTGVISEGLMMLATRQHVRAWEGELDAVHRAAAWYLYGEMWRWAEARKPDLAPGERRRLLDALFAPVHAADVAGFAKAVLLGVLFQTVLVGHLTRELPGLAPPAGADPDPATS